METSIPEIYNGVTTSLSTITNNSLYIETLYVIAIIGSFFWIFIEFRGTSALIGNLRSHFFTVVFIWLFFGSGAITSDVTVTLNKEDGTATALTYQVAPGFKYVTYVINSVAGWAAGAIGQASMSSLNIDVSKLPFAVEKYTLKQKQAEQSIVEATKDPTFANKNQYFKDNCIDAAKAVLDPPSAGYDVYSSSYFRTSPPPLPDCTSVTQWLHDQAYSQAQNVAKQYKLDIKDIGNNVSNGYDQLVDKVNPIKGVGEALKNAVVSALLRIISALTYLTAYIYAKALPFFLGILNQMYVGIFPLVVAMAMLPGRWMTIPTYFEGYMWLAFMPVVVAAVDGFSLGLDNFTTDFFDLSQTMIMLAKLSIVMSVPAITSFLIFGQRTYRVGPSNVATTTAHSVASLAGRAVRLASSSGSRGPNAGGPGTGPASRVLGGDGGWGSGNVVVSPGGRGQPPAGTPVTTASSNHALRQSNADAVKDLYAALGGNFDGVSHFGKSAVSGHIKGGANGGEFGGALDKISPEMKQAGVGLLIMDSVGQTATVDAHTGADGRMRYSTPEGGTASDAAMAERLNKPGNGELFAASVLPDGWNFKGKEGTKGVWASKVSWGKELSSQFLEGDELYKFAQRLEKDL